MSIKSRLKKIKILNDFVTKRKWGERKVCYGKENPDKVFFVIRRNTPTTGLFSFVTIHLGWIRYAIEKGYIPVVDMCNTRNTYLTDEEVGKKNAWEFYFEQPCGYGLEDVSRSKNVILSSIGTPPSYPGHDMAQSQQACNMWKQFAQKYLIVKPELREKLKNLYTQMFEDKRVLGVLCRGTDYKNLKPSKHPIQPEIEDIIRKAEQVMKQEECEYLYIATEDAEYLQAFQQHFGEKLRYMQNQRYENTGTKNINQLGERIGIKTAAERGTDYLLEIGLLAKCHCLVAGSVGGTYGAVLLNDHYDYQYIYDLGLYP